MSRSEFRQAGETGRIQLSVEFPGKRPRDSLGLSDLREALLWRDGLLLFNRGEYLAAHESWEKLWRLFREDSVEKRTVQGFIQIAVALLKLREGRTGAARRLVGAGLEKLRYQQGLTARYRDIDLACLLTKLESLFDRKDGASDCTWEGGSGAETVPDPPSGDQ